VGLRILIWFASSVAFGLEIFKWWDLWVENHTDHFSFPLYRFANCARIQCSAGLVGPWRYYYKVVIKVQDYIILRNISKSEYRQSL
jgi:hypothetical protein